MFRECESDFNFDAHLIPFLQDVPFFAEISRQIRKVQTRDIPTAAVAWDKEADELTMYVNPDFLMTLGNWAMRGLITHELYHLIFGHLAARRMPVSQIWNIATDLAINSVIMDSAARGESRPRNLALSRNDGPLPDIGLIPGQFPKHQKGRKLTKDEQEAGSLAHIIANLPKMKSSEWYYYELVKHAKKSGGGQGEKCSACGGSGKSSPGEGDPGECKVCGGSGDKPAGDEFGGGLDSMDDHSNWDDIPEENREYVEGKVKSLIEQAVRHADGRADGWGNIPSNIRNDIRMSVSTIINWRNVLQQFIGSLVRGGRRNSMKRINRRYPYIHPGSTRSYKAKLLVAIDQSGSVGDEMLKMFFGEIASATRLIDVDILPFDCYADVKDVWTWKKGQTVKLTREKCGGTCFTAPTKVFNDPKNSGRWDGMLIVTDGGASKPIAARQKRGWILGKGCEPMFETSELKIYLDDSKQLKGAWR